jgi:biotin carboxyl carrier protein
VLQGKDGAIEVSGGNDAHEAQYCLVTLLRSEGEVVAVSAVITRCRDLERARQRLQSMLLVAGYFDVYALRRSSDQARLVAQAHQQVLQLATSVATATGFQSAANNLCNELATRSSATRVTIGWIKGNRIRVKALSHTEQFDKKQELIVDLERAMEECYDQEALVQYDPNGKSSDNVTRSHQALSRAHGGHAVLSLPLRHKDEIVGVVTLEFLPNQQLGPHVANGLTVAVELLAPQLWDRYNNDRWLITKAGISTRETAKMVIGPKHMVAKLVIALVLIAVMIVCNIPYQLYPKSWPGAAYLDMRPMYRVSADFTFVPTERRAVSVPYEGELEKLGTVNGKLVKPGAIVKKGDVLAYMRSDDLAIRLTSALAQARQAEAKATKFRNDRDPSNDADGKVAEAEAKAAQADADWIKYQMDQAVVRAPIDGIVLVGDLEDKQGAKFEMGKALFEIGELNALKAEINVNERDVQLVQTRPAGRAGHAQPAEPDVPVQGRADRAAGRREGGRQHLPRLRRAREADPNWRPGMVGEARLDVEKRTWAWIWTHRLTDWVRLKLWM